ALAIVCLITSIAYHSLLPRARGVVRELVEGLVNSTLRGDLEIGQVVQLDTDRIVARDVVIRDPQGRVVIRAEEVTLWPNYRDLLLQGRVHTYGARLERGEVHLYVSGDDGETVSLVEAFQPVNPGPPGGRASPIPIVIDGIRLVDVEVSGDVPNYPDLHLEDIQAQGRIIFDESVDFHIYHLEGRMTGPYPGETVIDHAVLGFDTNSEEGLGAFIRMHRGEDRLHARVFFNRPGAEQDDDRMQHLGVEVHIDRLALETLAELGVPGSEQLAGTVRGDARLIGPLDDLVFGAWLQHEAGPISITGRIEDQQDIVVEAETHDFDVQRLVPAAPSVAVGGRLHLDVARDPENPDRARFQVAAVPIEITGVAIPAFEATGIIREDAVVIERIEAPHLGGVIEGRGRVGFDGSLDVHARIDVGDLAGDPNVARAAPTLHGAAQGTIDLETGPRGTDLELTTNLRLHDFRFGPLRARRLSLRGRARGELARPIVHFDVDGEGVAISGQQLGAVDARIDGGPEQYAVRWRSRGRDVRRLDVDATLRRRGDAWVIEAQDVGVDVGLGGLRGSIGGVRVESGVVTIDDLELEGNGQRIAASGRIATGGGSSDLVVDVEGLDLQRIGGLVGGDLESLRGVATAHLELEGPLREPEIVLRGRVEDVSFDRIRDADVTYELRYLDGVLSTNIVGDLGTRGTLGIEGPIAVPSFAALTNPRRLAETAEFDLHVYAGHLNLAFLTPLLGENLQALGITGRIGGDISIEGTLEDPRIEPSVIILDRFTLPGWSELRAKIHFALIDHQLTVRPFWIADGIGELAMLQAQLPISLDAPPTSLPAFLRTLSDTPWSVGARLAPRLLETWPRPLQG
ncbi:MAG: hypothetical protein M3Y87_35120, partial [Myxococcota bacterium]|nr:hypothetical protein [Myxococcota bacterium]